MDNKKLWNSVLVEIELTVSKANFSTWFKDTAITKQEDGVVYLSVPNAFVKDWLINKYHPFILQSLRNLSENVRSLEYILSKNDGAKKEATSSSEKQLSPRTPTTELPLSDFYINKDDNLNPRYTFETFVVGPFNELAHAAAQAIIKKPGIVYNPFFIYGNTGHGKTHLIQAIGNHIKNTHPEKKVHYATSEKFAMDYINSVQSNKVGTFKEKYRKYDILIMDDVQLLSKMEKTQDEFFHLFNNLFDNNKQIIFSSDKHPNFMIGLEDRIKSRLVSGMIVDIPPPDQESRVAILKAKSKMNHFPLSLDIIDFLASSAPTNIRELEGILNSIVCQSQLKDKALTLSEVKNIIKGSVKAKKTVSPKDIIKTIAEFYNIEEESIYEKTRKKEIIKPRQIIMYILREDFNISYPSIGEKMGGRDHTTVIHSYEKIKNDIKTDPVLVEELAQIRTMIV